MDNSTIAKLGSVCTWIRLVLIVCTFTFNIALAQRIVWNIGRRCPGCALLVNVCAANCVNLTAWLVITVIETGVWSSDLAPRLCKIQTLCMDFWEIFLLVNILAICVLNLGQSQSQKLVYRILSLTWIVSGILYAVPIVTSFSDVIKNGIGFYNLATVNDKDYVSKFGLMICEHDLSEEKNLIVLRYLLSVMPVALATVILSSRALSRIKKHHSIFSCCNLGTGPGARLTLKTKEENSTNELKTDLPPDSESETCNSVICHDCYYDTLRPALGILLLFHFIWQALLKPLCILSLAFSGKEVFFDVGSVILAIVCFYLPVYALMTKRTEKTSAAEKTPAAEKELKVPETMDVKTVIVVEAIEV